MVVVGESTERADIPLEAYANDPRWPVKCGCGYEFSALDKDDHWQVSQETIYRRTDTGDEMVLHEAPVGAIWNASWMSDLPYYCGPDGRTLICLMPGNHHWMIDGYASNCDSPCVNCSRPRHSCQCKHPNPYKDSRPHKCWVRSGSPECLTVGKGKPGESCGAGAGSILVPEWHGFLINGELRQC